MKKVVEIDRSFDERLYNKVATHPLQSWQWGEAREQMGIEVLRLGEFEDSVLINVFQLTFHKIPYTNFTIGYLPRSVIPSGEILQKLKMEGKKRSAIFIKLEPNVEKREISNLKFQIPNLKKSPHPLFPQWTQVLDLSPIEDELFKKMKQKTRYNIRLAEKKGVIVKEMTNEEGYRYFENLYFKTTKRQQYLGHSLSYHKTVFEFFKKDISRILIAFHEDIPLAAYHLFLFNDILYYPYGGSSDEYKNLMASNLIMWEAIRLGKKYHASTFDMWGSLPNNYDPDGKWSGFTRFKEGYGTEFVEFVGSYDMVINQVLYSMYNAANLMRKVFLNIKSSSQL